MEAGRKGPVWESELFYQGFCGGSDCKEPACNARDPGSMPGLERSPGERNGNPLQYSCLENPTDRGAWQATVHAVAKSRTWLSDWVTLKTFFFFVLVIYFLSFGEIYQKGSTKIYQITANESFYSFTWEDTSLTQQAQKGLRKLKVLTSIIFFNTMLNIYQPFHVLLLFFVRIWSTDLYWTMMSTMWCN